MVTCYNLISETMKADNFNLLLKSGIIPIQYVDWKVIYDFYCNQKATGIRHSEVIMYTAEEYNVSESTIWKIKNRMEELLD